MVFIFFFFFFFWKMSLTRDYGPHAEVPEALAGIWPKRSPKPGRKPSLYST